MSWFPRSTPRDVDGGLEARSRRGDIGEKWWSRKFVDVLDRLGDPPHELGGLPDRLRPLFDLLTGDDAPSG